jgi:hypothetical protein
MLAAKWAAKRFGTPATETDPTSWNAASFIKGALGAFGGGLIANMIKPGSGHAVLRGGLTLMAFKLLENKAIINSPFWNAQFGDETMGAERVPGVIEYNGAGEPFVLGEDYQWKPLSAADDYRAGADMYGDALVAPGPLGYLGEEPVVMGAETMYGDALVAPGPLGYYGEEPVVMGADMSGRSFLRR